MKERHVEVRFRFEELCVNANEDILFFWVGGGGNNTKWLTPLPYWLVEGPDAYQSQYFL